MSHPQPKSRLGILLAGAALLASLVVIDRMRDMGDTTDGSLVTPRPPAAKPDVRAQEVGRNKGVLQLHQLAGLRLDQLGATVSRPLFEPSRRPSVRPPPPEAPVVAPQNDVADTGDLRLIGVVHSGSSATALIAAAGGTTLRVEQGEVVAGWTVARISPSEVTLTRNGRQQVLGLFRKP